MLVLSRKASESIVIGGNIIVKIMRLDGDTVKIGIEAPPDVPVHRQEIYDAIQHNNLQALTGGRRPVPKLVSNENSSNAQQPGAQHPSAQTPPPNKCQ